MTSFFNNSAKQIYLVNQAIYFEFKDNVKSSLLDFLQIKQ